MDVYEEMARGMSDEELERLLASKAPWVRYRYKPQFAHSETKKTMGEQYVEAIEEEGDIEEVTKKFLRKMTRQAGATKEKSADYLRRQLEKAHEEGRL
jgi:hypothetical protein